MQLSARALNVVVLAAIATLSAKGSAGLVAGGAATQVLPERAIAQGAADAELARLQRERRIVLKGGVVLTLDRRVGDFAEADVLIEDGKIREVRPDIAISGDAAAVVDAANRIVIPGFIDTHSHSYQGFLRNILSNGRVDPDYNRDIQARLTPAFTSSPERCGSGAATWWESTCLACSDRSRKRATPWCAGPALRSIFSADDNASGRACFEADAIFRDSRGAAVIE
jgi:hypothetical protein